MRKWLIRVCLLTGLIATTPALAGTVIETEGSASGISRMLIGDGRLRMESAGRVVLFDAGARVMKLLDPEAKTYNVLDEEDVRSMAQDMEEMSAQVEKQLENLPEKQREKMREQIRATLPGVGRQPDLRVEATGETASVAGVSCREARILSDGEPAQEICVADPGELGIARDDYDTMQAMFAFFADVAGAMGGGSALGIREMRHTMEELGGMPVRVRGLQDGGEWRIRAVESRSIAGDRFEVPAGYRQGRAMEGMSE